MKIQTEIIEDEDYIYWYVEIDKGANQKIRKYFTLITYKVGKN